MIHLPPAQAADLAKLRSAWRQIIERATADPVFRIDLKNAWLEPKGEGEVCIVSNDYIHGNFIKGKLPELKEYISYLEERGFDISKPDYVENYMPTHGHDNLDKSDFVELFTLLARHEIALRKTNKIVNLYEKYKKNL